MICFCCCLTWLLKHPLFTQDPESAAANRRRKLALARVFANSKRLDKSGWNRDESALSRQFVPRSGSAACRFPSLLPGCGDLIAVLSARLRYRLQQFVGLGIWPVQIRRWASARRSDGVHGRGSTRANIRFSSVISFRSPSRLYSNSSQPVM